MCGPRQTPHQVVAALLLVACGAPGELADDEGIDATKLGGFSDPDPDTAPHPDSGQGDSGAPVTDGVDACDWLDFDLCFAFHEYDGTEAWCAAIGDLYGVDVSYRSACADDWVLACDLPAGGDIPREATRVTALYYAPGFDEPSAADTCTEAGGTPH